MQRFGRTYRSDPDAAALTFTAVHRQGEPKLQAKSMRRWRCPSCGLVYRCDYRRGVCPKRSCTARPVEVW